MGKCTLTTVLFEDEGFMYSHSFVDPDGHGWGLFHMSAMPSD